MKVTVTALDEHPCEGHPERFHDHETIASGRSVVITNRGVWVDRRRVLKRDTRRKENRVAGHPWVQTVVGGNGITLTSRSWTSFSIEVEP